MKTIVLYAIIGSTALAVGAGGGIIYKRVIMDPEQNIVGFNPDVCKADAEALFKQVDSFSSKADAADKMAPVDLANYASEKYKSYEHSVSYCFGLAKTIVDQGIANAQIRNGDTYFEESISKSSMVGVGKRMIQEGIDGDVKLYDELSKNDVSIDGTNVHTTFKSTPRTMKVDEYRTAWGRTLPDMFIYCVHQITVTNGSTEKVDGGYKVTLELDPVMGGYQYRYQMQTISGLDALPIFEYITLTYILDENLDLKHLNCHEKYKATMMGVSPDIENTLDYDFFPNKEWKIPDINEDIDYKSLKEMVR